MMFENGNQQPSITELIINMFHNNKNTIDRNADEKRNRNGGLYDPNIRGPVATR